MALKRGMSTRAPEKGRPEDVREYDPQTGGYTRTPDERPVPGTPNGTQGRLRGGR
ncbi:hypothetical protein [Streptomyces lydicamycinicus]|uniref:hypothetical protein n=1 Tax=Streptomyces lydicamycinicus TaxID=1546107 RepID=UPI003C2FA3E7